MASRHSYIYLVSQEGFVVVSLESVIHFYAQQYDLELSAAAEVVSKFQGSSIRFFADIELRINAGAIIPTDDYEHVFSLIASEMLPKTKWYIVNPAFASPGAYQPQIVQQKRS